MMNFLIVAATAFSLIALLFLFSLFGNLRRRRPMRATGALLAGTASAALGGIAILLAFSYYGYSRLVAEQVVGRIEFTQQSPGQYRARLMIAGEVDRFFELKGDEWQIDARVVSWKPPATLLGLDPIYQLDRLSGRYADVEEERAQARTVHALSEPLALDVWRVARRFPILLPGVDAYYGTATYLPMADGARFEVSMTRTALIARPVNEAARRAVGDW